MFLQGHRPIPEQINTICSCAVERSYSTGKEQWGRCAKATYLELKKFSFCYVGLSVMHACSHIILLLFLLEKNKHAFQDNAAGGYILTSLLWMDAIYNRPFSWIEWLFCNKYTTEVFLGFNQLL